MNGRGWSKAGQDAFGRFDYVNPHDLKYGSCVLGTWNGKWYESDYETEIPFPSTIMYMSNVKDGVDITADFVGNLKLRNCMNGSIQIPEGSSDRVYTDEDTAYLMYVNSVKCIVTQRGAKPTSELVYLSEGDQATREPFLIEASGGNILNTKCRYRTCVNTFFDANSLGLCTDADIYLCVCGYGVEFSPHLLYWESKSGLPLVSVTD